MCNKRREYIEGQIIGDNGCKYIKRIIVDACKHDKALFMCSCGGFFESKVSHVKSNHSWRCYNCTLISFKERVTKHGKYKTDEFRIYSGILDRTIRKNSIENPHYGGRGIGISDDWRESFENFYRDMGDRPSVKHSIDRIDNSKGYCKENCRWADPMEQANNKRNNVNLFYQGKSQSVSKWSRELNIPVPTITGRIKRGLDIDNILNVKKYNSYNKKSQQQS